MHKDPAAELQSVYRQALDLRELELTESQIARVLGVEAESIAPMLRIAELKAARLQPTAPSRAATECARAFAGLGSREARALRLRCHGVSLALIAEALGLGKDDVTGLLNVAEEKFFSVLDRRGVAPTAEGGRP